MKLIKGEDLLWYQMMKDNEDELADERSFWDAVMFPERQEDYVDEG